MITQEIKVIGGKEFLHTYSDEFWIVQNETGVEYEDAMDLIPCQYSYSETERPLHPSKKPEPEQQ